MSGSLEDESLMFSDDAIDELDLAGILSCIIEEVSKKKMFGDTQARTTPASGPNTLEVNSRL